MRCLFLILLFISFCKIFSQQQNRINNSNSINSIDFDVIISLSAVNTDNQVEQIKSLINGGTTGLTYEGYCKNQKCIILKASSLTYNSVAAVVAYLKSNVGNDVLCSKNYTIQDFYKLCTFESEEEYHYFKITYR